MIKVHTRSFCDQFLKNIGVNYEKRIDQFVLASFNTYFNLSQVQQDSNSFNLIQRDNKISLKFLEIVRKFCFFWYN